MASYINGTSAREIYEESQPRQEEQRQQYRAGAVLFRAVATTLLLAAFFSMGIGIIYMKSAMSVKQLEINKLDQQIEGIQYENSKLDMKINQGADLKYIRAEAEKMGMGYPHDEYIQYIDVDNQSGGESLMNE